MKWYWFIAAALAAALIIPMGPAPMAAAASVRLNGPLAAGHSIKFGSLQVTPNGQFALFLGDMATTGVNELFSVPVAGGPTVKLSHTLPKDGTAVIDFHISPDSSQAVYGISTNSSATELWSVPVAGGTPVRLTPALATPNSKIGEFLISPVSGGQVVYNAEQEFADQFGLYRVPIGGGTPVKLSGALPAGRNVFSIRINSLTTPGTARATYLADATTFGQQELFSVPIMGGAPSQISGPAVANGAVEDYTITPNGQQAVFQGDLLLDGQDQLFFAPLDGSSSRVHLDDLPANTTRDVVQFVPTLDSSRVIYRADRDVENKYEVFSVSFSAIPTVLRISSPLADDRSTGGIIVSPDSIHVLYSANSQALDVFDLFFATTTSANSGENLTMGLTGGNVDISNFYAFSPGVFPILFSLRTTVGSTISEDFYGDPFGAPPPVKLNRPLVSGNLQAGPVFNDGGTVRFIYLSPETTVGESDLHSVSAEGPATSGVTLNAPFPLPSAGVQLPIVVPGTSPVQLLFTGIQPGSSSMDVFRVPASGATPPVRLTSANIVGGFVSGFLLTSDSSRVVYSANQDDYLRTDLYSRPVNGGSIVKLSTAPVDSPVNYFKTAISPNGAVVAFLTLKGELWSVPTGGGTPVRISGVLLANQAVFEFKFTPDSSRVVFHRSTSGTPSSSGLFVAPADGSAAAAPLFNSPGQFVQNFVISGDSQTVAYSADIQATPAGLELWRVAIAGGASTRLSGNASTGVQEFKAAPNGTTLVYRSDETVAGAFDLYSVPFAGGPAQRLSRLPSNGRSISQWQISADSTQVIYSADQDSTFVTDLYSAPIGGGSVPTRIAAMPSNGDVKKFAVSPTVDRVAFLADRFTDEVYDLWSVPIGGGVDPVKLSGTLPVLAQIQDDVAIDPTGARAVFRRYDPATTNLEIFSTPLAGGDPVRLNAPLPANGQVFNFVIGPGGSKVLFTASRSSSATFLFDLYQSPAAGGGATLVNDPLVDGGSIFRITDAQAYAFTTDGLTAMYLADQLSYNNVELFAAALATPESPPTSPSPTSPPPSSQTLFLPIGTNALNPSW